MDWFLKREKILFGLIFGWIIFVATWYLGTNPHSWFDEGIFHQIVSNLVTVGKMTVQLAPGIWSDSALISVGYPVFYPAAVAFNLFGDSILVLRSVAVIFLLGLVVVYYGLVRTVYGVRSAILSLWLLAFFSPLYGNGKNFLGEVPGLFYFVTGLWLIAMAENYHSKQISAPRLFFGLVAAAKPTYLVVIPAVLCGFLWQWRWSLCTPAGRKAILVTSFGFSLPLLFWLYTQFTGATSLAQIFAHYSNPYYIDNFLPIIGQNVKRFFTESTPAHFLLLGMAAGYFLIAKIRQRQPLVLVEVIALAFVGAIILFYVRTAGWYRYFFPAHIILFMFLPAALEHFFTSWWARYSSIILIVAVAGLVGLQSLPMIQERFRSGTDVPTSLQSFLAALEPSETVLFFLRPQLAARYHGSNYSQYIKMSDSLALGSDNLMRLKRGEFSLVFLEENVDFTYLSCYDSGEIRHGIRILRRVPLLACP